MNKNTVKKSCKTCEFNCGAVCAGYGKRLDNGKETYGMSMKEAVIMFPEGCGDYGISLWAWLEQIENKEKHN